MYQQSLGRETPMPPFRIDENPMPAPPPFFRTESAATKTKNEKKTITRNRASYSCHNCRRRKIKCDKTHPICGGCRKTNERCVYNSTAQSESSAYPESSPEDGGHGAKRRKPDASSKDSGSEQTSPESSEDTPDTSRDGSIVDRLDRLTSLVEALSKGKGAEDHADAVIPDVGGRQEQTNKQRARTNSIKYSNGDMNGSDPLHPVPSRYQRQVDGLASQNLNTERASKTPDFDMPTIEAAELADPMSKMNLGFLSVQEGGRSRYVGSTFWAYVSDEIDQLNTLLRDQNRYSSDNCSTQPCGVAEDNNSPGQESDDSLQHNSFHKAGDHSHVRDSQFRNDCAACLKNATDKSVLLQSLEAHPSRFKRMDSDMVAGFPTETQSHILFRCWLSGVHGQIPLIYPPLVLKKYESVWEWYKNGKQLGQPHPEPGVMPVLYAIWYAGSVSISLRGLRAWFPGTSRAKLSAGFHDQITRSLTLVSFPRNPSTHALAAFLMLQMILAKEEEPMTSSLYVSLAIRVAQTLGLHREPTLFNFPAWEVETRRRLWWQIVQNDCFIAIASGLPPLINSDFFDTKMISEIKDPLLGTPEANAYQEGVESGTRRRDDPDDPTSRHRTSMVAVHYVVARGKYVMCRGLRRLLKIHLGTKPMTKGDMQEMRRILSEVDHDINETIKRIPTKGIPEMGFTPDRDEQGRSLVADVDPELARLPTEDDLRPFIGMTPRDGLNENTIRYHWNTLVAYHKWARIVLSLIIDKMYCVSYAPFLKNAKSKLWPAARHCALRHCHSYMRKFISLATDPAFQPFQWSWPGMHQPMHAAMIMLVDLYERPNSVEAPRSRAFIDKIFSMSGPDGGIVSGEDGVTVQRPLREGGREAWDMLRRLREKAWQKAGLDSDVLWTEEDQIRAGVATPLNEVQRIAQSLREDKMHIGSGSTEDKAAGMLDVVRNITKEANATFEDESIATDEIPDPMPRPKTLQRLSTMQQPTPFRSSVKASPSNRVPIADASGDANYFASSNDGLQNSFSGQNRNPIPVPEMAPPVSGYFNPPTAVSSANDQDSRSSTWSQTTPTPPAMDAYQSSSPNSFDPSSQSQSQSRYPSTSNPNLHLATNTLPPPLLETAQTPTAPHEHFDWKQWDAVFGQHPGFDVLMDDGDVSEAWESSSADVPREGSVGGM